MSDRPVVETEEDQVDRLLAAVPTASPPLGFRETVLRRVGERRVLWEWIIAALFAVPSLLFLVRQASVHGDEFTLAFGHVVTAASGPTANAFFFVDGLTVIALALLGIACSLAAHAAGTAPRRWRERR